MPLTVRASLLASLIVIGSSLSSSASVLPAERSIPLTTVTDEGHRYVVRADVDRARDVPLMVHGNASMYLSLTHRIADRLNGKPVAKTQQYGYSSRGKGVIDVGRIRIGGETFPGKRRVAVFDFDEHGSAPFQGLLGVPFFLAAGAAVDFTSDRLLLGVAREAAPDRHLLARGYRWTPITHDGKRTRVKVTFPALGRAIPITPSTVANALTLHHPLFAGAIAMVKTHPDRSPNGTTPDEYRSDRVAFEIAGARMTAPAIFENIAEYGKQSERDLEAYGYLGYDWMKEHRAVTRT